MKQLSLLLTLISFVGIVFQADALEVNKKMGKPTDEEMNMTVYAPDPDAEAVKLYSSTDVQFEVRTDFIVVYRVKERIKVLKPEGTSAADVTILFFDPVGSSAGDKISGVKGSIAGIWTERTLSPRRRTSRYPFSVTGSSAHSPHSLTV